VVDEGDGGLLVAARVVRAAPVAGCSRRSL
jgi:hypothetical protein